MKQFLTYYTFYYLILCRLFIIGVLNNIQNIMFKYGNIDNKYKTC